MPAIQTAYLALVILCFASFMATLAWGVWFTRERRSAARKEQGDQPVAKPEAERRAA